MLPSGSGCEDWCSIGSVGSEFVSLQASFAVLQPTKVYPKVGNASERNGKEIIGTFQEYVENAERNLRIIESIGIGRHGGIDSANVAKVQGVVMPVHVPLLDSNRPRP